jgi:hypothetical protein
VILELDPALVRPQLPEYHCQLAPGPSEPPFTESVALPPGQKLLLVVEIPLGGIDAFFTLIEMLAQDVLLQSPSALTK